MSSALGGSPSPATCVCRLRTHVSRARDDNGLVCVCKRHGFAFRLDASGTPVPCAAADAGTTVRHVCAVLGIVSLYEGPYLIVVTKMMPVGSVFDSAVFCLQEVELMRVRGAPNDALTERQRKAERTCLRVLHKLLNARDMFVSYDVDLTSSLQRRLQRRRAPLAPDERFFWNKWLVKPLLDADLHHWVLPVIRGCVQVRSFVHDGQCVDFALVSRRARHRAGARYLTRGADEDGHAANYVETEQLLGFQGRWTAFLQVRGSIPLGWEQLGKQYRPVPRLLPHVDQTAIFDAHFGQLMPLYRRVVIVNLLDAKGPEHQLSVAFADEVRKATWDLTYHAFDFHAHCSHGQYENVGRLLQMMQKDFEQMGYTLWNGPLAYSDLGANKVEFMQVGIFRTNCMDCLDRTNLVQSIVARESLLLQMDRMGLSEFVSDPMHGFDGEFKEVWANNGDAISKQYAGTNALKGDFTRTGKRKAKGVVRDGFNSINRYIIKRFKDRMRQMALDLITGVRVIDAADEEAILDDLEAMSVTDHGEELTWSTSHTTAMEACVDLVDAMLEDPEEMVLQAWPVTSINKRGQAQQRIFVLTSKAYYRCKYSSKRKRMERHTRVELSALLMAQHGWLATSDAAVYGVRFWSIVSSNESKAYDDMYTITGVGAAVPGAATGEVVDACESPKQGVRGRLRTGTSGSGGGRASTGPGTSASRPYDVGRLCVLQLVEAIAVAHVGQDAPDSPSSSRHGSVRAGRSPSVVVTRPLLAVEEVRSLPRKGATCPSRVTSWLQSRS